MTTNSTFLCCYSREFWLQKLVSNPSTKWKPEANLCNRDRSQWLGLSPVCHKQVYLGVKSWWQVCSHWGHREWASRSWHRNQDSSKERCKWIICWGNQTAGTYIFSITRMPVSSLLHIPHACAEIGMDNWFVSISGFLNQELVKKYSEFIDFPIYLWASKEVDVEVLADEEEQARDDRPNGELIVPFFNSFVECGIGICYSCLWSKTVTVFDSVCLFEFSQDI